jgi:hypothetical protein
MPNMKEASVSKISPPDTRPQLSRIEYTCPLKSRPMDISRLTRDVDTLVISNISPVTREDNRNTIVLAGFEDELRDSIYRYPTIDLGLKIQKTTDSKLTLTITQPIRSLHMGEIIDKDDHSPVVEEFSSLFPWDHVGNPQKMEKVLPILRQLSVSFSAEAQTTLDKLCGIHIDAQSPEVQQALALAKRLVVHDATPPAQRAQYYYGPDGIDMAGNEVLADETGIATVPLTEGRLAIYSTKSTVYARRLCAFDITNRDGHLFLRYTSGIEAGARSNSSSMQIVYERENPFPKRTTGIVDGTTHEPIVLDEVTRRLREGMNTLYPNYSARASLGEKTENGHQHTAMEEEFLG